MQTIKSVRITPLDDFKVVFAYVAPSGMGFEVVFTYVAPSELSLLSPLQWGPQVTGANSFFTAPALVLPSPPPPSHPSSAPDLLCRRHSSFLPNVGDRASPLVSIITHLQILRLDYGATARAELEAVATPSSRRRSAATIVGRRELGQQSCCSPDGRC
jgi:hypothetical protein